jgi:uncharacterized membrane protein YhiD involved in acid resistance
MFIGVLCPPLFSRGVDMDQLWQFFETVPSTPSAASSSEVLLSLLLAFILGQVFAWVYYFTHSGLSYSKSFVQSLIVITVIVSLVMTLIGSSIVSTFGLIAALGIVRFRNVLKDTRDVVFIFGSIVIGMATGFQRFSLAVMGTIFICSILIYLHVTSFGAHEPKNGFLRFQAPEPMCPSHPLLNILRRYCTSYTLISVQDGESDSPVEYAYQLMVKDRARSEEMMFHLKMVKDIYNVSLSMQEELLEV